MSTGNNNQRGNSASGSGSSSSAGPSSAARYNGWMHTGRTSETLDFQARGRGPYYADSDEGGRARDAFAAVERRRIATSILGSPELLTMAAVRNNESVPATRLHYLKMLYGFEDPKPTPYASSSTLTPQQRGNRKKPASSSSARSTSGQGQQA